MKRIAIALTAMFFILVGTLPLFAVEQEQQKSAPKTSQEKEHYEKGMKERLGKLGEQLDKLKNRTAAKSEQAGEKIQDYLAEAELKKKAAALKLEEISNASKDRWEKFTTEMEKAAKDFEQAFEKAKSRFKE